MQCTAVSSQVSPIIVSNGIDFCISGGYPDIFINSSNFDEKFLLEFDNRIALIPNENYVNVAPFEKRFGVTVTSDTDSYKIDFVLMNWDTNNGNNYLFSEFVTGGFDIDVCWVSIINVDEEYRLILNSSFKVFIRSETLECVNYYDDNKIPMPLLERFSKYEGRLVFWSSYRIFFTDAAPPFDLDHLMRFHQLYIMEWYESLTQRTYRSSLNRRTVLIFQNPKTICEYLARVHEWLWCWERREIHFGFWNLFLLIFILESVDQLILLNFLEIFIPLCMSSLALNLRSVKMFHSLKYNFVRINTKTRAFFVQPN